MGRGDWDHLERDIARSEHELARLGANEGGLSRGIVTDLVGLFDTPNRARAQQQAQLAEAAEYLGPQIARERGISEGEARAEITGGVQQPEPGYRSLGRLLGLVDPPEGEPFGVRMGKLRGMAARFKDDAASRKENISSLGDLIEVAGQLENPDAVQAPLSAAARRAGLGDIGGLKFKPAPYKNLWDYSARTGKDPVALMQAINARRGGGGGGGGPRPTVYELVTNDLTSPDPRRRKAAEAWLRKSKGGASKNPMRDLVKTKFETDMTYDPELRAALDVELGARAAWMRGGRQGPEPETPTLDRYSAMMGDEFGEDGMADLGMEPDDDVGADGQGVYLYEDHDDILNSIEGAP